MSRSKHRPFRFVAQHVELEIESIDFDGNGIGHHNGKVHFVEGAITGERVIAEITQSKPNYSKAITREVVRSSSARVEPTCPHFGVCGGCSMQHVENSVQVAIKNRALEDLLLRIGRQRPEQMLQPVYGPFWHYRHRARLAARLMDNKGMLLGFHEKGSSYVANMEACPILPKHVSAMLVPLAQMLEGLSVASSVPQLELAVGEGVTAWVLQHLKPLSSTDKKALKRFGEQYGVDWWLQPEGPSSVHRLLPQTPVDLLFSIPSFGIQMHFRPTDFTQVNHMMNDSMVSRAISLLALNAKDRALDLFCGLGNFTLPLAQHCAYVKGLEGSQDLVNRAHANAILNQLHHKTEFHVRNLFEVDSSEWESWGIHNKVLIDPPRDGALQICKAIVGAKTTFQPERIVYVSCNPATLARDSFVLCSTGRYRLTRAGVVNMFPHTSHVESIAVFELDETKQVEVVL